MNQQQKYTTQIQKKASKVKLAIVTNSKPGRRGEVKYQAVCIACRDPKPNKRLITIRRASGDLHLCRTHYRAWLGEL